MDADGFEHHDFERQLQGALYVPRETFLRAVWRSIVDSAWGFIDLLTGR